MLTPAQRDQVPRALERDKDRELRDVAAKLGVTPEQKQRIDKIREEYHKKFRPWLLRTKPTCPTSSWSSGISCSARSGTS